MIALSGLFLLITPALAEAEIGFEADAVTVNQDDGSMLATGNVVMTQAAMTLRADEVRYNREDDVAVATGNVEFIDNDGAVHRADIMTLDTEFTHIVGETLRSRYPDNSFFIADEGDIVSGGTSIFDSSRFSACNCDFENGETPIWDLRATSTRHIAETKTIVHSNVRMHILNVPIGYLPYLAHPDWTVRRRTGFLAPSILLSSDLGFSTSIPYFVVLGDTNDLEFTPYRFQRRGLAVKTRYRQKWDRSDLNVALYTGSLNTFKKNRESVAALDGIFSTTIGDDWNVKMRARRSSQDTFMRRYKFNSDTWLKSSAVAERIKSDKYYYVEVSDMQSLSSGTAADHEPTILPHVFYEDVKPGFRNGQTLKTEINAIQLDNDEGHDMSRWVGNVEITDRLSDGPVKTDARAGVIGSYYSIQKNPAAAATKTDDLGRITPMASVSVRYPLAVSTKRGTAIVEPQVQFAYVGGTDRTADIPNRDSADYRIDPANLFLLNRYQGYDYLRPGSRLDMGVSVQANTSVLGRVSGFMGVSQRLSGKPSTGLAVNENSSLSDYVASLSAKPFNKVSVSWSGRLAPDDLKLNESKTSLSGTVSKLSYSLEHMQLAKPYFKSASSDLEELTASFTYSLGGGWKVIGRQVWNLSNGKTVRDSSTAAFSWTGGLQDCLTIDFGYDRDLDTDRDIKADDQFTFTMNFKYLGSISKDVIKSTLLSNN
ncbi:MAG: LPS-assembly protein LptD [Alphaproteobacteria bacterium]|nr:LPS-assembly protein LptD [Alphaproteobacteria bacterium]